MRPRTFLRSRKLSERRHPGFPSMYRESRMEKGGCSARVKICVACFCRVAAEKHVQFDRSKRGSSRDSAGGPLFSFCFVCLHVPRRLERMRHCIMMNADCGTLATVLLLQPRLYVEV